MHGRSAPALVALCFALAIILPWSVSASIKDVSEQLSLPPAEIQTDDNDFPDLGHWPGDRGVEALPAVRLGPVTPILRLVAHSHTSTNAIRAPPEDPRHH